MTTTGVPLDPVYTMKGVRGLLGELKDRPAVFSGKKILFIHTGEKLIAVLESKVFERPRVVLYRALSLSLSFSLSLHVPLTPSPPSDLCRWSVWAV